MKNEIRFWATALCVAAACSRGGAPAPQPEIAEGAAVAASATADATLGAPWRRLRLALDAVDADPESSTEQVALLEVLYRTCASPDLALDLTPEETGVFGEGLARAHALALEGRGDFLEVLMDASLGAYGRTAEGAEWLNELLWQALERHPDATLAVLAERGDTRAELIERVYTRPVHDGFDFAAIHSALETLELPEEWAHMEDDVRRIRATVAALSDRPSPR